MELHQKKISVTDLVCEANRIWEEYRSVRVNAEDPEAVQKIMDRAIEAHPDFAQVHIIIVRYIVQMKMYSPVAVQKYANHILANPWKSLEDMIEAQVYYVKNLYKFVCKYKTERLNAIGDEVRTVLLADAAKYKAMGEEQLARHKAEEEAITERLRRETQQYFEQHGADVCNIPIRAVIAETRDGADIQAIVNRYNTAAYDVTPARSADSLLD
jgi:hypothetical protein